MKFIKNSNHLKAFLLILIVLSTNVIDISSKINNSFVKKNKKASLSKVHRKKKAQITKKSHITRKNSSKVAKEVEKKLYDTEPTKDEFSPGTLASALTKTTEESASNANLTSLLNQINIIRIIPVSLGCVRISKDDFITYQEVCEKDNNITEILNQNKNEYKKLSLQIATNLKVVLFCNFIFTSLTGRNEENLNFIFTSDDRVNNFPFEKCKKFKVYLLLAENYLKASFNNYLGSIKEKGLDSKFEKNNSLILGPNTVLETDEEISIFNDLTKNRLKKDLIIKNTFEFDYSKFAKIEPNCMIIITSSNKEEVDDTKNYHFCNDVRNTRDSTDSNRDSILSEDNKESVSLILLEKILKEFNTIILGSDVTAVLFTKQNFVGNGIPLTKNIIYKQDELTQKIGSIYMLNPGCAVLFKYDDYESLDEKVFPFRICSSLNSIPKANRNENTFASIILAKNTRIILHTLENFQGESIELSYSSPKLRIFEKGYVFKSISIIQPKEMNEKVIINDVKSYNNPGCILTFSDKNYEGLSTLHCLGDTMVECCYDERKFKSIVITPGEEVILTLLTGVGLLEGACRKTKSFVHFKNSNPKFAAGLMERSRRLGGFELVKSGCVYLFNKEKFEGELKKVCENSSDLSSENNQLANYLSIIVGKNTKVTLYNGINFTSNKVEINSSIEDLSKLKYLDEDKKEQTSFKTIFSLEFDTLSNKQRTHYILNSNSKSKNLFYGVFIGLLSGDFKGTNEADSERAKFETCLNKSEVLEFDNDESKKIKVITSVSNFHEKMKSFFNILSEKNAISIIIKWYCNFKEKLLKSLTLLTSLLEYAPKKEEYIKDKISEEETVLDKIQEQLLENLNKSEEIIDYADREISKFDTNAQSLNKSNNTTPALTTPNQTATKSKPRLQRKSHHKNTPTKRKFRVMHKGFISLVKDMFEKIKNWIAEKAKNYFKEYVADLFVEKAKEFFIGFVSNIQEFFQSKWILEAIKVIGCSIKVFQTLYKTFLNFYSKIKIIIMGIGTITTGFGILILLDFIFSLLCNLKYFKLAFSYLELASKKTDDTSYSYYGLGIGIIFNTIGNTTSIAGKLIDMIDPIKQINYQKLKNMLSIN